MQIGEVAAATGASTRLLRYYEERGLIAPDRDANGYRSYSDDTVVTVARIRRLLAAGLPVRAIREILDCACGSVEDVAPCLTPKLREELTSIDDRLDVLAAHRTELNDLIQRIGA